MEACACAMDNVCSVLRWLSHHIGRTESKMLTSPHITCFWIVIICFLGCVISSDVDQSAVETCLAQQQPISKVINFLGHKLTTQLGGNDNLIFSPLSVSVALAMVYLGARGDTEKEMEEVLRYDQLFQGNSTSEDVHRQFASLLTAMANDQQEYKLLTASGMFSQQEYKVLPQYVADLQQYYSATQQSVDFAGDGLGALKSINDWVSNNTMEKIKTLFSQPLNPMTRMVLLSAVYFKGAWEYAFNEEMTDKRTFYGLGGSTKQVPFMEYKRNLLHYSDDQLGYDFVELPYRGKHVSMFLALPQSRDEFPTLELTSERLCNIRANLRYRSIALCIPKFKLAYEKELSDVMLDLGLVKLFSKEMISNLTGIRSENDLYLSILKHKAVIELNEQGTEAAAVSGAVFFARSGLNMYHRFFADHPFIFAIVEKRSGSILFSGRVVDP